MLEDMDQTIVKTLNEKLNHGMKYLEDIKNNIMKK
jgi:hypothetical protein